MTVESKYINRIEKVNQILIMAMLDYVGVPIPKQPRGVKEKRDMLRLYAKTSTEAFDRAFKLIILHEVPEGSDKTQAEIDKMVIGFSQTLLEHAAGIERTIKEGIGNKTISLLKDIYADVKSKADEAIEDAKNQFITHQVKVGNKPPKTINGIVPKEFDRILALAASRKNIFMTGPSGCGKTYIAKKVAEALGLDFASQSCSEGVSESVFTGWLLPVEGNGVFTHVQSEFIRIYENGGAFLFDEMDAADPNVMVFMNQALANDGFYLPQRHKAPYVKKHKDFVGMAAANTFGNGADTMFVGRNQLDAATMDRFRVGMVKMEYDETVETNLVDPEIYEWGMKIRKVIVNHRMRRIMSTRVMLDASDMKREQGWTIHQIEEGYFADWSADEYSIIMREVIL